MYTFEEFLRRRKVAASHVYLTQIGLGVRLGTGIITTAPDPGALFIENQRFVEIPNFGIKPAETVQDTMMNGFVTHLFCKSQTFSKHEKCFIVVPFCGKRHPMEEKIKQQR